MNNTKQSNSHIIRAKFILIIFVSCLLVLLARILYLYIEERNFLQDEGDYRTISLREIEAVRGKILDVNNFPLAASMKQYSLYGLKGFTKSSIPKDSILLINTEISDKRFDKKTLLKRNLSLKEIEFISLLKNDFLEIEPYYQRYYPTGEQASTLVGFAGKDGIGLEGMEKLFDYKLIGTNGKEEFYKNNRGETIKLPKIIVPAQGGKSINLTVDSRIQFIAYKHLSNGVVANKAKGGSVVILDNIKGEILAISTYPSYNPNNPQRSITRNRALVDEFEPGSLIKPIALAIALQRGHLNFTDTIDTSPGRFLVNNRAIIDHKNLGLLTPQEVILNSSQIGASKIALRIGSTDLISGLKNFGFSKASYIDFPNIKSGHINQRHNISEYEVASLGFGYGIDATVLQVAEAFSIFANQGIKKDFILVKGSKRTSEMQVVSPDVAKQIMLSLEDVVALGTGTQAQVNKYRIGGKTGTAHISKKGSSGYYTDRYYASFVGIAPIPSNRYTIVVSIEEPNPNKYKGGEVAAPIFKNIIQDILLIRDEPNQQN
tara:strand:+ start:27797 stop:29434 length:1638 start_codon:yes stop_codon:yes gene_type:complete